MNILFATYEASPFYQTGGLGDVAGRLPLWLAKHNITTYLTLPKYSFLKLPGIIKKATDLTVSFDNLCNEKVGLYMMEYKKGVILTLLDHKLLKDPMNNGDKVYNFAFFSKAIVEASKYLKTQNKKISLIHANDWFSAFTMYFIKMQKLPISTLFTIHNLSHKGKLNTDNATFKKVMAEGYKSSMEVGIVYSDHVNTVSPTYAREIVYTKGGGSFRKLLYAYKSKVTGILNGIGTQYWNPKTDRFLKTHLKNNVKLWKNENKKLLLKKLKLDLNKDIPLVSFIGRLDPKQKGIDLLYKALESTLKEFACQCVILGTGDQRWEKKLGSLVARFPGKVAFINRFDGKLSHEIYAGSDILIVPSKFEPCGLIQMIAMRYGALPLVRKTGGLADTVKDKVNGFVFDKYSATELTRTLRLALKMFKDNPEKAQTMIKTAMKEDFSWDKSAREYKKLYQKLLKRYE